MIGEITSADAFMAELILDGMQQMAKAAQRTPRGRQAAKKARTA